MHIYASCGLWKFDPLKGWGFAVDKNKRGKVLYMELTSSFQDLRRMAFEYFGIDQNLVEFELSYLPMELTSSIDCPPVIIESDRQVKKFLTYVRGKASTRLCVSTSPISGNNSNIGVDNEKSNSPFREQGEPSSFPPRDDSVSSSESSKDVEDNSNSNGYEEDDVLAISAKEDDSGKSVRFSLMDVVKRGEMFQNKTMLKVALGMSAMKHNFDYKVVKSDRKLWYIRCKYNPCKWSVRAEGLSGSTYFIIKKYVADHTCAASSMNNGGRTASAKTIGGYFLIFSKSITSLMYLCGIHTFSSFAIRIPAITHKYTNLSLSTRDQHNGTTTHDALRSEAAYKRRCGSLLPKTEACVHKWPQPEQIADPQTLLCTRLDSTSPPSQVWKFDNYC
ncbi:hypothetical protein F2Q70_00001630 [Brassica cretica]|uniref:Transposase MuDR plant domain-containing protein n=1 Tax=Brassica cretica TaxID=69181 RepID=A0A8S9IVP5_BRACR|nr:hypothetical protein F2Q70_00001630 [Brassica cretica]